MKSRTTQLIFQTVYCVLAVIGVLSSLGYFAADFNEDFYIYYTHLSNYVCMTVMFLTLHQTAKASRRKEDGYCTTAPTFTFLCVILILVTFLVYNILLADQNTVVEYFTSLSNMLLHVILPVMFILHWLLFYPHGALRWYHPLLCAGMPFIYLVFIVIRAALLKNAANAVLYPYFFLNADELGWDGFFAWIGILLVVFIAIGYAFCAIDHLIEKKKKQ